MKKADRTLTMIDLFAGCGGLSLGMEKAGFNPIFVSELNKDAMSSYVANRPFFQDNEDLRCNDIEDLLENSEIALKRVRKTLRDRDLLEVSGRKTSLDLICGGPPCQGFSGIGHRRSHGVDKQDLPSNQLFHKMLAIIQAFQPKIFLFENVKGLLSAKWTSKDERPNVWKQIFDTYQKTLTDYTVRWELVYSKDYEVPQNRPRVLMVGIRNDVSDAAGLPNYSKLDSNFETQTAVITGFLPSPNGRSTPGPAELLGDLEDPDIAKLLDEVGFNGGSYEKGLLQTTSYPSSAITPIQIALRTQLNGTPVEKLTQHQYSKHSVEIIKKFKYMIDNEGKFPEGKRTKKFAQRVLGKEWPSSGPNITATSLPDDYVHYAQPRILTVREWARLQTFPDWYEFHGPRTTGGHRRAGNPRTGHFDRDAPLYTQIGNAVPVKLAEHVGEHFQALIGAVRSTKPRGTNGRCGYRRAASQTSN
jgi:DNA (cytosine-5)-methyltransferase 1